MPILDTYPQDSAASFDSKTEEREEIADTLHLYWRWLRNKVLTLQDQESQQEKTLESQPVHLVIFTCKDTITPGTVDYQSKMLNFELYVLYSRAELAIFNSNHNRH